MKISIVNNVVLGALALSLTTACTNRYSEKSPDHVSYSKLTPEERIARKNQSRESLLRFKKAVERVDRLSGLVSKIVQPYSQLGYSTMDFLKDVFTEFHGAIPDSTGGEIVRKARYQIPEAYRDVIVPECHVLDLALVNRKKVDQESGLPVDVITLSSADCARSNNGEPIVVAELVESERVMKANANQSFFRQIMRKVGQFNSGDLSCTIERGQESAGSIRSISCDNVNLNATANADAYIQNISMSEDGLKAIAGARLDSPETGSLSIGLVGSSGAGWEITLKPDGVLAGTSSEKWTVGDVTVNADGIDGELQDMLKSIWDTMGRIKSRIQDQKQKPSPTPTSQVASGQ